MFNLALVFGCLTCAGHGQRAQSFDTQVQTLMELEEKNPFAESQNPSIHLTQGGSRGTTSALRPLARALLAAKLSPAFNPSGAAGHRSVGTSESPARILHRGLLHPVVHTTRLRRLLLEAKDDNSLAPGPPLWLDLRGSPCAQDMDTLLSLYEGVRKRLDEAGVPPPTGTAVTGILHDPADLDGNEGNAKLPVLTARDPGELWLNNSRVGQSLVTSTEDVLAQHEALGESMKVPDKYFALLGPLNTMVPVLNFVMYLALLWQMEGDLWEQDKGKSIVTTIMTEIREPKGLSAVSKVARDYSELIPIALLLKPDQNLWFDALGGMKQEKAELPTEEETLLEQQKELGETVYYANAVLTRNARQLGSYWDEAAQWQDQDNVEQYHVLSKLHWEKKLEDIFRVLNEK